MILKMAKIAALLSKLLFSYNNVKNLIQIFWILPLVLGLLMEACQNPKHPAQNQLTDKFALIHQTLERYRGQAQDRIERNLENLIRQAKEEANLPQSQRLIEQANRLFTESGKLLSLLEQLKAQVIQNIGGGRDSLSQQIRKPEASQAVSDFFILEERGYELALKLDAYVDSLNKQYSYSKEKVFERITQSEGDYIEIHFGETPVVGALAVLTQIQLTIIGYQEEVLRRMCFAMANWEYDYQQIWYKIIPRSDTIRLGQTYQAKIFWDYVASKEPLSLMVQEDSMETSSGFGQILVKPSDTGRYTLKATLHYPTQRRDSIFKYEKTWPIKDSVKIQGASTEAF